MDDFDIFACYRDLWKTMLEKGNAIRQGIISNDGCTENCNKLRINAGDKSTANLQDDAVPDTYGNKFIIPLDFLGQSLLHSMIFDSNKYNICCLFN